MRGSPVGECTAGLWCISVAYLTTNYNALCFRPLRGLVKNRGALCDSALDLVCLEHLTIENVPLSLFI